MSYYMTVWISPKLDISKEFTKIKKKIDNRNINKIGSQLLGRFQEIPSYKTLEVIRTFPIKLQFAVKYSMGDLTENILWAI